MKEAGHSSYRWLSIGVGLLIFLIIIVVGYIIFLLATRPDSVEAPTGAPPNQYDGITRIDGNNERADFVLTDQQGDEFASTRLAGKLTLMAFGFTRCPDICPLTLGEIRAIHEGLAEVADQVNYVLISVDGNRDTPDVMRNYLELLRVDGFMIGLTGSEEAVRTMSEPYGVQFVYGATDENGNYSVDHTAGMFLLDRDGQWIRRYAFGTLRTLIIHDIQAYLRENP